MSDQSTLPFVVLGEQQPIAPPVDSGVIETSAGFRRREKAQGGEAGELGAVGEEERERVRQAQAETEAEHAAFRKARSAGVGDVLHDLAAQDKDAASAVAGFLGIGPGGGTTTIKTRVERAAEVECTRCSAPIDGLIKSAAGGKYHPACFTCAACGCQLQKQFATVRGAIHCVPCAKAAVAKK